MIHELAWQAGCFSFVSAHVASLCDRFSIVTLSDNMPKKPQLRMERSREARWGNKIKAWPNMGRTRKADSSSDNTRSIRSRSSSESSESSDSSDSDSDEDESYYAPSRQASARGQPKMRQREDVEPNPQEFNTALNGEIRAPPKAVGTAVILKPKPGIVTTYLPSESAGKVVNATVTQGSPTESATSSRDTNRYENPAQERERCFDCTACGSRHFSVWEILEHPDLGVGICSACYAFLFSSPYTKDINDSSEEQCRWCGQGGRIVMCDRCDKSFCETCIIRNYGPKALALILSSTWSCFCCDPESLRAPILELKDFHNSVRQVSEGTTFLSKRKGPSSWAGLRPLTTRNASKDETLKTNVGGATIADLLDQEDKRRKQNNEVWTRQGRVKTSPDFVARRKSKKSTRAFPPAMHCYPAFLDGNQEPRARAFPNITQASAPTEVKQEHAGPIQKQASASATFEVKQEHITTINELAPASARTVEKQKDEGVIEKKAPASARTEVKQKDVRVIEKKAPDSANPATKTIYIRPHQWEKQRQEAASRRKRAAEIESLKNVSNHGPKPTNSNTSEHLLHNVRCKEKVA